MRDKGKIVPMDDYPVLTASRPARSSTASSTTSSGSGSRPTAARLRLRDPRRRPLPRQLLLPARLGQRRLPPRPARDPRASTTSGVPQVLRELTAKPRGFVLVTGPDRLGQVDDAGGDGRPDQRRARGPHPHDRGPDRVPPPAQELDRQPARDRRRRPGLRPRPCAPPCERTPT